MNKKNVFRNVLMIVIFSICALGCEIFPKNTFSESMIKDVEKKQPLWTFIIYMSADNELSASAIEDLNEIEAANAISKDLQIFALVDYSGDGKNNPNSGTFLYKIKNDSKNSSDIVSEKISCPLLEIEPEKMNDELNLSDKNVLKKLITFIKSKYPSKDYGLIMWGHGTGYKSDKNIEFTKGLAVDDNSNDFMSIVDFGKAIKNEDFSIIGFDTCFGMLLEIIYEIRNTGGYFIGSSGLIPASGWDYKTLFSEFSQKMKNCENPDEEFCKIAKSQFENQYSSNDKLKISYINLNHVQKISKTFDDFCKSIASKITDNESQKRILKILFNDVKYYSGVSFPTDLYLDLYSFSDTMIKNGFSEGIELKKELEQNEEILNIGINFVPLVSASEIATLHDSSYIKNDNTKSSEKLAFVLDNINWVPNYVPQNSLLDKLFYITY